MFLGGKLKELRENANVSQKEIGEAIGVSDVMISMYEQDKKNPSLPTIVKLAEYFGVSVDYLLGREHVDENEIPLYMSLAKSAQDNGISLEDIKLAIETIKQIRGDN